MKLLYSRTLLVLAIDSSTYFDDDLLRLCQHQYGRKGPY